MYYTWVKHLFQRKDVAFDEILVDFDREQMRIMMERSRRHTVPQIFIGDLRVGGFDALAVLEVCGELDLLLEQ